MIDTCQAASMYEKFYSPNILAMASSLVGEDSLSVISHFQKTDFVDTKYQFIFIFSIMLIRQSEFILLIVIHSMLFVSWKKYNQIVP